MASVDGLIKLQPNLVLSRCPHCGVDCPNLTGVWQTETAAHNGANRRKWIVYLCSRCGGLVSAWCKPDNIYVEEIFPGVDSLDDAIPNPAREYLQQAIDSLHSAAGAVMLAASAVDAMLKAKNYKEGSLYARINQAAADHLITAEMSTWAHQVRLDANDQRHADGTVLLPQTNDARRSIHFAQALATFLFSLPNRGTRGLKESAPKSGKKTNA